MLPRVPARRLLMFAFGFALIMFTISRFVPGEALSNIFKSTKELQTEEAEAAQDQADFKSAREEEADRFKALKAELIEAEKEANEVTLSTSAQSQHSPKKRHANTTTTSVFSTLHAFYYPWYGSEKVDGKWYHWNHVRIAHWDKRKAPSFSQEAHTPPDDIASKFYPALGPYSSADPAVIENHMQQIKRASIGVIIVTWYSPSRSDPNGKSPDALIPALLDAAQNHGIKVAFHLEPYEERTAKTIREELEYIFEKYSKHPAFYKHTIERDGKDVLLPMFYVYDSYQVPVSEWQKLFDKNGELSVRNSALDGLYIGLLAEHHHLNDLAAASFDGAYTYFASIGFSDGSKLENWPKFASSLKEKNMLFIPSIGPGYDDTPVRPWNTANIKDRDNGAYYEKFFRAALQVRPAVLSITSFNEWHEGTQIERAQPITAGGVVYSDYAPNDADFYLDMTARFGMEFQTINV